MTTTTAPTTTVSPAPLRLRAGASYVAQTIRLTFKTWSYALFTIAMPVVLYLVFNALWGSEQVVPGVNYSALIMVQMAAYGALGAAMSGGAVIAMERRSGWFRQLMLTMLPPRAFLIARAVVVMAMVLPSLLLVFGAGYVVGGVRLPAGTWIAALALMWVALIPPALLGLVIGLWVKGEAVPGANTMVLLLLALGGGLWFPMDLMPQTMQTIGKALPSYWLAQFGNWPLLHDPFPFLGVAVLAVWVAALIVLGALGYRRAAATSKR